MGQFFQTSDPDGGHKSCDTNMQITRSPWFDIKTDQSETCYHGDCHNKFFSIEKIIIKTDL